MWVPYLHRLIGAAGGPGRLFFAFVKVWKLKLRRYDVVYIQESRVAIASADQSSTKSPELIRCSWLVLKAYGAAGYALFVAVYAGLEKLKKIRKNKESKKNDSFPSLKVFVVGFFGNLAPHPYFTRSKGNVPMASESHCKDSPAPAILQPESVAGEENKMLRLHILKMWDAWSNGEVTNAPVPNPLVSCRHPPMPTNVPGMPSVALEADYFQDMMSAMGKQFAEATKIGEMVENGLKIGRI
uniref:Uncharacterized protein LOC104210800 n=1 Tax=Nicotiana sylvestris TaxID=4096 RepID=A0A1U7UPL9_NICSY|nr:PREDICTED: uncharacterized protein LOC104210800 [Nicotiana sylvestris]